VTSDHPIALPAGNDICQPFLVFGGAFRGRLVRLTGAPTEILRRHKDPVPVATLEAEAMAAAVALAAGLKYEGIFTLQIQTDGPVSTLVADVTSDGGLRAWARFDEESLARVMAQERPGFAPRLLGSGHLAFTVDQGPETERYQGIVELAGGSLAESVHQYFRQSEQLASALKIAVKREATLAGDAWTAAAVVMQQMPEEGGQFEPMSPEERDDAWRTAVVLLGSVTDSELLDTSLTADKLLYRLFGTVGVRTLAQRPIQAVCRCSRERSIRILASFPADEICNLSADGIISMTCEFCREVYTFGLPEVAEVAAKAAQSSESADTRKT
jgi:molecular chaperone Hsp33